MRRNIIKETVERKNFVLDLDTVFETSLHEFVISVFSNFKNYFLTEGVSEEVEKIILKKSVVSLILRYNWVLMKR